MRILVTGAAGWLGGTIVPLLAGKDVAVTAAARTSGALMERGLVESGLLRFAAFDLSESWPDFGACDAVVHLGGESRPEGRPVADYVRKNIVAMERLLAFCRRTRPRAVVFASSLSVFGRIEATVANEEMPCIDPQPYGMSKRLCEELLAENGDWLPSLSLRLPGVLGPGAWSPWLASLRRKFRAGEAVSIYNPEAPFNNAVHVRDLADLILRYLRTEPADAGIIVLGAGGTTSVRTTAETLKAACGSASPIEVATSPRSAFTIDSGRARRLYGYAPMDILAMLRQFAAEE